MKLSVFVDYVVYYDIDNRVKISCLCSNSIRALASRWPSEIINK